MIGFYGVNGENEEIIGKMLGVKRSSSSDANENIIGSECFYKSRNSDVE